MEPLPQEIWDAIVLYAVEPNHGDEIAHPRQIYDKETLRDLGKLRLVSRIPCESASEQFFRHLYVTLKPHRHVMPTAQWPPDRLLELSKSRWADHVRDLDIDLSQRRTHHGLGRFLLDMRRLLPECLRGFQKLTAVGLRAPQGHETLEKQMREDLNALAKKLLPSIRNPDLNALTLSLPLAHNYFAIMHERSSGNPSLNTGRVRDSVRAVTRNIEHLSLAIHDETWDYPALPEPRGWEIPARAGFRPRDRTPQNKDFERYFFDFMKLPSHLSSLTLFSAQALNMDQLGIENLPHLHSLDLKGFKVSSAHLLSIVEAAADSLQAITLKNMELKSGTWEEIFIALCKLEHLHIFRVVEGCGYDLNGSSARWHDRHGKSFGVVGLSTRRREDQRALFGLHARISSNRRAKGIESGEGRRN